MHLKTIRLHGLWRVKAVQCDLTHKLPTSTLIRSGLCLAMSGRIMKPRSSTTRYLRPCFMHTTFSDLSLLPSRQILPCLDPSDQSPASHRGRPGLTPTPAYMGFMVGEVTLRHDILPVLRLPTVRNIPPVLYGIFCNT